MRLVSALVDHVSGRGELEVRVPVRAGGRGGQGNPDGDALPHPERSEVAQQLPGHRARAGSRVLDGVDAGPALLGQKELRDVAGVRLWVARGDVERTQRPLRHHRRREVIDGEVKVCSRSRHRPGERKGDERGCERQGAQETRNITVHMPQLFARRSGRRAAALARPILDVARVYRSRAGSTRWVPVFRAD